MELDLINILMRKRKFVQHDTIFAYEEHEREGELKALSEMIDDVSIMNEKEFVDKYLEIISDISKKFETGMVHGEVEIDRLSYYNNMIVWVLKLVNPIYEYDLDELDIEINH